MKGKKKRRTNKSRVTTSWILAFIIQSKKRCLKSQPQSCFEWLWTTIEESTFLVYTAVFDQLQSIQPQVALHVNERVYLLRVVGHVWQHGGHVEHHLIALVGGVKGVGACRVSWGEGGKLKLFIFNVECTSQMGVVEKRFFWFKSHCFQKLRIRTLDEE